MADKKKTTATKKKIGRAPSLYERITDFSTNGATNIRFIPKDKPPVKKNGK